MLADHFSARLRRREYLPLAASASERGRRYCLARTANAEVVCRTSRTGRTGRTKKCRPRLSATVLVCPRPLAGMQISLQTSVSGNAQMVSNSFWCAHAHSERVARDCPRIAHQTPAPSDLSDLSDKSDLSDNTPTPFCPDCGWMPGFATGASEGVYSRYMTERATEQGPAAAGRRAKKSAETCAKHFSA